MHASVAQVAPKPAGAELKLPAGFRAETFATGLEGPRKLVTAPNGDIFVAEQPAGRIRVLRAGPGAARPSENSVFAQGLEQPFGIAFWPVGPNPQWVYVAELNRVVRYPYASGDLKARGQPQVVVPRIAASSGGHWTRDIAFSPDGQRLYIAVGSSGNIDEGMGKKSIAEAQAWDAGHGLGAAWANNENRADLLVAKPDGSDLHVFAAGIRNCSGLTIQPATGQPWCSVNERDVLGDNLVPDYATHVQEGHFYGWPWYYIGDHEDPRLKGERPDLKGKVTVPDVLFQPHSAAVQILFYNGAGPQALPFEGDAFVALHGSWNRSTRTGYKVVRVPMKDGRPAGGYIDFLTGFVISDNEVWGRPYGLAIQPGGALLVSDDASGAIFRITPAN
jgi:glucose/arabinose dehydrogenase